MLESERRTGLRGAGRRRPSTSSSSCSSSIRPSPGASRPTSRACVLPALSGPFLLKPSLNRLILLEQLIYRNHSYHATPSYASTLSTLTTPRALVDLDRIVQFPYVAVQAHEQTEEEARAQMEKRAEATRRLKETAARQRSEKVRPAGPLPLQLHRCASIEAHVADG